MPFGMLSAEKQFFVSIGRLLSVMELKSWEVRSIMLHPVDTSIEDLAKVQASTVVLQTFLNAFDSLVKL